MIRVDGVKRSPSTGPWLVSALRLLTNCCGDPEGDGSADANRAQVVAKVPIPMLISMMHASESQTEAVSLVYNIGVHDGKPIRFYIPNA